MKRCDIKPGDTFGYLTVISDGIPIKHHQKNKIITRRTIKCECVCGNIRDYTLWNLKNGDTRSCGCYRKVAYRKPQSTEHFDYGFLQVKKRDAIKRGIEFMITTQDLEQQYLKQNGLCYYTGRVLPSRGTEKGYEISLDRFNNDLGYTKDNIVLCLPMINIMKYTHTYEDFIKICRELISYYDSTYHQPSLG